MVCKVKLLPQSTVISRNVGLTTGGKVTEVSINPTTWTALPSTALEDRNAVGVQNRTGQEIKVNYDPGVSGYVGMVVSNGSERTYDITDGIILYAKSIDTIVTVNVEEIA